MMTDERPALDVRKFDQAVKQAVTVANQQPRQNAPPEYRFMQLTDDCCDALLEAARNQLTMAENNMKQAELHAQKMREDAKRRWQEYENYVRGLEDFGQTLLSARDKFHKANGK